MSGKSARKAHAGPCLSRQSGRTRSRQAPPDMHIPPMTQMTTAEAIVASLIAHRLDTLYALPGVQNDHLFDALFKSSDTDPHRAHAARTGRRLHGARRRARHRQAAGLRGGAGAGPAQFVGRAAHRLFDERAGAGAGRADPGPRHRPQARPSARDQRPGRHSGAPGRSRGAGARCGGGAAHGGGGVPRDGVGPARPGRARMRHQCVGQAGRRDAGRAAAGRRARDRRGCAARCREASRRREESDDRGRRRRAGCLARGDARWPRCCRRRCCAASAAARACSMRAIRSPSRCRSGTSCGARPTWCSRSARGCSSSTRCGAWTTISRSSR